MGQIVEITGEGRAVHVQRGFLDIREGGTTLGQIALDDIETVIGSAHGIMWSNNALAALAQRSVPVVILGQNFLPQAYLLSVRGHHEQGAKIAAQAAATLPVKKRLWAQIVKAKIAAQAEMLALLDRPTERLDRLKADVQSGDTTNREAVAAQYYWPHLFEKGFTRERSAQGINAMLNYGYAILRAATARAIVGTGLSPSLSLHHSSHGDALRLADDLMEPFRPSIDLVVHDLVQAGENTVSQHVKRVLGATLQADYRTDHGRTPLSYLLVRVAQSLSLIFQKEATTLALPHRMLPCRVAPDGAKDAPSDTPIDHQGP